MSETYDLVKWVWSDADFDAMAWHDSRTYVLAFLDKEDEGREIIFDIDYIFQWNHPQQEHEGFSFWVSPATLVFEWIWDLSLDIGSYVGDVQINNIKRQAMDHHASHLWTIECQEGEITLRSSGFRMYVRAAPVLGGQELSPKTRGYSFHRGKIE